MTPAAAGLLDTLSMLWPEAVLRPSRRHGRSGRREVIAEYAFAPNGSTPSLAVPTEHPRATAAAMARFHAGLGTRQLVARSAAAAATRIAPGAVLGDRVDVVGSAEGSLAEYLTRMLGEPVLLLIGIGTERVNRKPVVGVLDTTGRALGFAKVGSSPVSAVDVTAETQALARLAHVDLESVRVPRLVGSGHWRGHPVLVATALPTSAAQPVRWRDRAPVSAMRQVQRAFAEPQAPASELGWFAVRAAELAGLADRDLAERVQSRVASLRRRSAVPVEVGAWHGDWTPWNMAARGARGVRADQLYVWDWERFETGVPQGLDAIHYRVNVATQRQGTRVPVLLEALGPIPPPGRADIAGLYLMAITARYLTLAQGPGGDRIAERGRTFVDAWCRRELNGPA